MKHEHVMCRANDIKQKRLLGSNPTTKQKNKFRFTFFFPYLLFFAFYFILSFFYIPFFLFQH